jgi:hypothetical protein
MKRGRKPSRPKVHIEDESRVPKVGEIWVRRNYEEGRPIPSLPVHKHVVVIQVIVSDPKYRRGVAKVRGVELDVTNKVTSWTLVSSVPLDSISKSSKFLVKFVPTDITINALELEAHIASLKRE